ncbi:MAG: Cof-type HAD-IIB family hydrolase [Traorella sp.]
MTIKLLAIDMDGTCLNSKCKISDENLFWLRKASSLGIQIIPTTGRSLSCLPYQLKDEHFYRYVITSNGAVISDMKKGEDINKDLISNETALDLMKECQGMGLGMCAHIDHEYYVEGKGLSLLGKLSYGKDASSSQTLKNLISFTKMSQCDVEELQFFFFNKKAYQKTVTAIKHHQDVNAAYTHHYVEIFSQKANKGKALVTLANILSIDQSEIACIGDSENDLSMFQYAHLCFAMNNACEELKDKANRIVSSNDANGVSEAIQAILNV